MNRLMRELVNRGLVFETDEMDILLHNAIDCCTKFVGIYNGVIVLAHYSQVLDPMYILYDLNFNEIAKQDMYRTNLPSFDGTHKNPWFVCTNEPDKVDSNQIDRFLLPRVDLI